MKSTLSIFAALALLAALAFLYVAERNARASAEAEMRAAVEQADAFEAQAREFSTRLARLNAEADSLRAALDAVPAPAPLDTTFVERTRVEIREVLPPEMQSRFDSLSTYWTTREREWRAREAAQAALLISQDELIRTYEARDSIRVRTIAALRHALDVAPGPDGFFEDAGEVLSGVGAGAALITFLVR